jgi:hypothetical protein
VGDDLAYWIDRKLLHALHLSAPQGDSLLSRNVPKTGRAAEPLQGRAL